MEVRGVLVHPELLQAAVTHVLVQDLHLLHPGHARQVLLRGEGGSVLELQTKVRIHFTITDNTLTSRGHPQILSNTNLVFLAVANLLANSPVSVRFHVCLMILIVIISSYNLGSCSTPTKSMGKVS